MSEAPVISAERTQPQPNKKKKRKVGKVALRVLKVTPAPPPTPKPLETVRVGNAEVFISHELPMQAGGYSTSRKRHSTIFRGFTDPKRHG